MDSPRSWQMMLAWKQLLSTIRTSNGYRTDAGQYVTLEPSQIPDGSAPVVLAAVMDMVQLPQQNASNAPLDARAAPVAIIAKVYTGDDMNSAQELLHSVLDDVEMVVLNNRRSGNPFPSQVTYPRFAQFQLIPAADGPNWVGAELRYLSNYIAPQR